MQKQKSFRGSQLGKPSFGGIITRYLGMGRGERKARNGFYQKHVLLASNMLVCNLLLFLLYAMASEDVVVITYYLPLPLSKSMTMLLWSTL